MNFKEALSVLSKSSPFAVSTHRNKDSFYTELKSYLYIERQIEKDFVNLLQTNQNKKRIIFLCGSSGDGKSEILLRYQDRFEDSFDCHIDATHSFHPDETAIEALNKRFDLFKIGHRSLIIGINTGMLGNYCEEGADEHKDIRDTIRCYLNKSNRDLRNCLFLSFEDYPVFDFSSGTPQCSFAKSLMQKITAQNHSNPFYRLFEKENEKTRYDSTVANYKLLSIHEVQDSIIELLLMSRLAEDQFITSRTLLDFLYEILCGKGLLFENLFESNGSELLKTMQRFDPAHIRSRKLDEFIVKRSIGTSSNEFEDFLSWMKDELGVRKQKTPQDYLRLFFLLGNTSVANEYHRRFQSELRSRDLVHYIEAWRLHDQHAAEYDKSAELRGLYRGDIGKGLQAFFNRKTAGIDGKAFLISEFDNAWISSDLKLKPDLKAIGKTREKSSRYFNVFLTINNQKLSESPVRMSFNMFTLLKRVGDGYRPTAFSSSSLVSIEELVRLIMSFAKRENAFTYKTRQHICTFINEEPYIEVEWT